MRRIYRHFDLPRSGAVEARMRAFLDTNPKDANGTHVYSLRQFGLDPLIERARYREYLDRRGVAFA